MIIIRIQQYEISLLTYLYTANGIGPVKCSRSI